MSRCKKCKKCYRMEAENDNFICSGTVTRGTRYKHDTVWLCLKGELAESYLEMTPEEAQIIVTALVQAIT